MKSREDVLYPVSAGKESGGELLRRSMNPNISENMRIVLIDWLIDVSIHFEVQQETLHYCVAYLNKYPIVSLLLSLTLSYR